MKIIFLDIDGVLNRGDITLQWLSERIEGLKSVLQKTGAKVVIHSGWRTFLSHECLGWIFQTHGISRELIIDVTPGEQWSERGRVESISAWLSSRERFIERWVVIDDLVLELPTQNFVLSDPKVGPDWTEVERKLQ